MLWNDICRCPREMQAVSVLSHSQPEDIWSTSKWLGTLMGQRPTDGPQWVSSWVPSGREAEEALSGAFTITLWGMVKKRKRSYGSIWQTVFVSLRLRLSPFISVSLTTEDWDYERYILISKNYDSIIYNFSSSWIYNTQNHMVLWNW